jgi:hypothetical protein
VSSDSITKGFFNLMALETDIPIMFTVAGTPDSVLASHSLSLNALQYAPGEIRGSAELIRLALAGRTRLITAAHRAASTWRKYVPSDTGSEILVKSSAPDLKALCGVTLIENSDKVTISGTRLIGLLVVLLFIVSASFSGPIWRFLFWQWTGELAIRWRSRGAGQMHRMVHEKGDHAKFWSDSDKQWPKGTAKVEKFGYVVRDDEKGRYHPAYSQDAILVRNRRSEIS